MSERAPDVSAWIGRRTERQDVIDERLIAEFRATLSPHLVRAAGLPPGIHWCLCPDMLAADQLGGDGHPRLGVYLPDVGLPRRMWAGGEIAIHGAFTPGDCVTKISTIENVAFKSGKSGGLCFVTLRNHYLARGELVIDDRQDIVYREPAASPTPASASAPPVAIAPGHWLVTPTPVMLFRYSAMTFNAHRIHYDEPYACGVEGYEGLVVHGPLQATLMLNLAASRLGRLPRQFSYRGIEPLICGRPFVVDARPADDGCVETRVVSAEGVVTMSGALSRQGSVG
jgi:3-methylfumaryl-CoA hydratase